MLKWTASELRHGPAILLVSDEVIVKEDENLGKTKER